MTTPQPIEKILIANRGEIAQRVMRTCRRLGISTVAIFSDADANLPFVREADEAVRVGPAESTHSYLNIARIVEAAQRTGADAIHPGYGFLAENADFACACTDAGVIFIGPTPEAIRAMGSKREAKALMQNAGVPVVPGYEGTDQSEETLIKHAKQVGFPLLIKASAGGGGKGMKLVEQASDLAQAIQSAKREAKNAFGDDTVLIEKYIQSPRHVEIQILGDAHGTLLHLFERECSVQRRYQKIVEETPCVVLDEALRAAMCDAAVKCGQALGYQSSGTVEFILDRDRRFYFLEVNTRLQVEHPVTECVTGVDLVEQQIRVAQGERLALQQQDLAQSGAAIEVRLYAEDADQGFLPQTGRLVDWHLAPSEGLRVDTGIEAGSEISIYYDPMVAKIIAHGSDREQARRRLCSALRRLSIQGVTTNRAFLLRVLEHPAFIEGETDTHFIERHLAEPRDAEEPGARNWYATLATLAAHARRRTSVRPLPAVPLGWRNNYHTPQWVEFAVHEQVLRVEYRVLSDGALRFFGAHGEQDWVVVDWDGTTLIAEHDGQRCRCRVVTEGPTHYVHTLDGDLALEELPRFPDRERESVEGACLAPMPGKVVEVRVQQGDAVEAGQVLLVMEAMKMEHTVTASEAGVVEQLRVAVGDQVEADAVLIVVG